MEEGVRWQSYSPHEDDLRIQNHGRDYESYEVDARKSGRVGHFVDGGQSARSPGDMASRRKSTPSAMAHHGVRGEGPNWILIAGGAIVTAIGAMIVRRPKPTAVQAKAPVNATPIAGKDRVQQSGLSFASTRQESTGSRTSELSTDSPYSGDLYYLSHSQPQVQSEGSRVGSDWGDDECPPPSPPASYRSQFPNASSQSNRTIISPTSPPESYRGADTSATECNDPIALSPSARLGFSSRRDVVHRLRQQLKNRDEMILDMQAQISDQECTISSQQAYIRDQERRFEDTCRTLRESDLEIQRLRKAVADYLAEHIASGNLASSTSDERDSTKQIMENSFLVSEAGRLAEELRLREDEKQELERLACLKVKEHDIVVQKLQMLESELEDSRKSDFRKDLLLEAYEVEQEHFEVQLDSLKRLMETKLPETPPASSKIGRRSLSGGFGLLKVDRSQIDTLEDNSRSKGGDFSLQARNLVRSYSTLLEKPSDQSVIESSSTNGPFKTEESSSNGDQSDESETEDSSPALSEKLVMKLRQEVEQLSIVLAEHSNTMSEKRSETSRLVDEFQKHNSLIYDLQKRMDADADKTPEQMWDSHSQYLSFSNNSASAAQVQELSHKLEQIANQQRVEEEIADLSKHQVKISELKQRVERLLSKCDKQSNGNFSTSGHLQASKMAAAGIELAKQLELQEEQARRTSREVQRLLASFELSSPYVPRSKKEELRKMLQGCSSESLSPRLENGEPDLTGMSYGEAFFPTRFATGSEGKPKESVVLIDGAISVSPAEPATSHNDEGGQALHTEEQYVYGRGISPPSTRKPRRGFPIQLASGRERSRGVKRRLVRASDKSTLKISEDHVGSSFSNRSPDGPRNESSPRTCSRKSSQSSPEACLPQMNLTAQPLRVASEAAGAGEWPKDASGLESGLGVSCPESTGHRVTNTESSDALSNSSTMSTVSASMSGRHVSLASSIESKEGSSFGKFLFDMEGHQVYSVDPEEFDQQDIAFKGATAPPLSPSAGIVTSRLDMKDASPSPEVSANALNDVTQVISDSGKNRRTRSSTSGSSIDSSFDALLSNTLDDLLGICSTPSASPTKNT